MIDKTKAIIFKDVNKSFSKKQILNNINFEVTKGSFHALIGENGSGKTTIIRTMLGLYQEYIGTIKINGINTLDTKALEKISYLSEHPVFPNYMNVWDYLIWSAIMLGKLDKRSAKSIVLNNLKQLNIEYVKKSNPNKLSSGEKKKILLIQTMVQDSDLIILDEPAANLDPKARKELFNIIKEMNEQGKTIFICSHVLAEIEKYCNETTIISGGEVKFSGSIDHNELTSTFEKYAYTNFRGDKNA